MKLKALLVALAFTTILASGSAGAQGAGTWVDGVYPIDYVDAELGSVSLSVTVQAGHIVAVTLPADKGNVELDDASLASWLKTFMAAPDFLTVDAISGATQSCNLIKYAVQAALKKASSK